MTGRLDTGSFRDPRGRVYLVDQRVFRTVMPMAVNDYEFVRDSGFYQNLVASGRLVDLKETSPDVLNDAAGDAPGGAQYVLEHPMLPFISYPYEWSFSALKAAALLQLDIYLEALDHDITLTDATAYNVQFNGTQPIFIDHLAFRRYNEGEYWMGHRQFCEQYLNPLLLRAKLGIPHNAWLRGSPEGITALELKAMMPLRKKLSWNVFTHVVLQASFQKASQNKDARSLVQKPGAFPKNAFRNMLRGLHGYIAGLKTPDAEKTVWGDYATDNSYATDEGRKKREFISRFASQLKPRMLWDIGCNTGDYSKAALDAGAESVIGFDFDAGALETAFSRAQNEKLNLQPLFLDATNPTPDQGWAEHERKGLSSRATADGLLALALVHHIAITKNVPLAMVVDWLVDLAPHGVVEFVPKTDPMVQELLRLREDIFPDYSESVFLDLLGRKARIVETENVSESGRLLIRYQRT